MAGTDTAAAVTGPEADVMLAAYYAAEVAAKTIKAGNTNTQVNLFVVGAVDSWREHNWVCTSP